MGGKILHEEPENATSLTVSQTAIFSSALDNEFKYVSIQMTLQSGALPVVLVSRVDEHPWSAMQNASAMSNALMSRSKTAAGCHKAV